MRYLTLTVLIAGLLGAQPVPSGLARPAILEIEIDKVQFYWRDSTDATQFAASQDRAVGSLPRNFPLAEGLGDIVAVNGTPVKGTMTAQISGIIHNTEANLTAGQAVADTFATGRLVYEFDIWNLEGRQIGTIYATGLNNAPPPPGAAPGGTSLNLVVVGGTGAFLGVRGQMQHSIANQPSPGPASIREDPGRRRVLYSGRGFSFNRVAYLIPWRTPEIEAVFHADLTPVSASKPARAGETLVLRATGLGPTRPETSPGQAYPAEPFARVNSPVTAIVNGQKVAVVNALGWPGEIDRYRVDVILPAAVEPGQMRLSLEAAWIPGSEFLAPTTSDR